MTKKPYPNNTLEGTDLMPWGKHAGRPLQEIPAKYLHWLWTGKDYKSKHMNPLARYIRNSIDDLEEEYPDGIWRG